MSRPASVEEHIRGQLFIAGNLPTEAATITITVADSSVQDDSAPKQLAVTTIEVEAGKARKWTGFGVEFSWPEPRRGFNLAHLNIRADIKVSGKLAYCTQTSNRVDLTGETPAAVTLVAEPV